MSKKTTALVASAIVAILAMAGIAWACTPSTYISLDPDYGKPGTVVTVHGTFPSEGEVAIYWESTDSQPIGSASGRSFSVAVTIPNVPYDTYTIVARATAASGGKAQAQFTVTDRVASGGTQQDTGTAAETYTGSGSTTGTQTNTTRTNTGTATKDGRATNETDTSTSAGTQTSSSETAQAAPSSQAPITAGVSAGASAPQAGASAAASAAGPEPASQPAAASATELPASVRSISSDLWSGFSGERSTVGSAELAGPQTSADPSAPLMAGMALIGFGAVAGFAGLGIAVAHRRRAFAQGMDSDRA